MTTPRSLRWLSFAAALALAGAARGEGAYRYDWLAATNLPPPSQLVDAALTALPKSVKQKQDWLARMRKAAWVPSLEFRYTVGEAITRDYRVVDRVETTTGSESQREKDASSSSRTILTGGGTAESTVDGGGASTGGKTTLSQEASRESSSSRGSRSSQNSFRSTTYSGLDSYATGEDTRWVDEFGIFLTWDLSRVLFRQEEIAVVGVEMDRETFRQSVKSQVIQAYYDLLEALMLLDSETYRASIPTQVKRERLAYLLDSLTDGALSGAGGREAP